MSTVYYIINKKENDKYEKLCEFLKDESRKVLNDFIEFEKNFNCDSISDDVSYEINSLFNSLRYKLVVLANLLLKDLLSLMILLVVAFEILKHLSNI